MKKQTLKWALALVLIVCIAAALPGLSAAADNIGSFTVGQDIGTLLVYASPLEIEGCSLSSGGLPSGLKLYWDANGVYLTGKPGTEGGYSAVYTIQTSEGAMDMTLSCTVAPAPEPTPTPTPEPSEDIVITKHPSGEFVELGDDRDVKFVARAENYTKIVWRLVSPDTMNTVQASEAPDYFRGLEVSGLGTETLVLKHIPRELDNWCVEAQFWNGQKHVESAGAKIYLVDAEGNPIAAAPTAPPVATTNPAPTSDPNSSTGLPVDDNAKTANISIQPESVEVESGDAHTLSVIATSPNNGSLSYQWYSAATDDINAALPISGASDASYTIEKAEETTYYWVAVWNVKEGVRSQPVFSETAAVRVHGEPTPTPAPTPTPEPTPEPAGASTINFQLVMFSIIGLLALAALIAVVVYLRADAKHKYDDDGDEQ
ncbi:MAG: hypothetical protein Q4E45_03450 [Eubacteriales bacterium]|nr:hypothetical protein [Eubacteriales bacterium]